MFYLSLFGIPYFLERKIYEKACLPSLISLFPHRPERFYPLKKHFVCKLLPHFKVSSQGFSPFWTTSFTLGHHLLSFQDAFRKVIAKNENLSSMGGALRPFLATCAKKSKTDRKVAWRMGPTPPFLRLPSELRLKIYEYLLPSGTVWSYGLYDSKRCNSLAILFLVFSLLKLYTPAQVDM